MQIAGPDWPEMAGKIGRKIGQKLAWKIGPENLSLRFLVGFTTAVTDRDRYRYCHPGRYRYGQRYPYRYRYGALRYFFF